MARYQHLPVYQACYAMSREAYRLKIKMPQALKHDLGSDFFRSTLRCVRLVVFANGSQKKQRPLMELSLEIEVMWTLSRLLHDLRGITKGEFQIVSERLNGISSQVSAWTKWERGQGEKK